MSKSAPKDAAAKTTADAAEKGLKPAQPRGFLSRMLRSLFGFAVLFLVFVACLPMLISQTSLKDRLPRLLVPQLPAGCQVGGANLGWFTPVSLQQVHLPDDQGGGLLDFESLTTNRTLWQLAQSPHDLGKITITKPRLRVVVRPDGTSLSDVLNRFPPSSSSPKTDISVTVTEAEVQLEDPTGLKLTSASIQQGMFQTSATQEVAWSIEATANVTHPTQTGSLRLQGAFARAESADLPIGPGQLRVDFVDLPLDGLKPLLEPLLQGQAFAGQLTGSLAAEWKAKGTSGPSAACLLILQQGELAVQSPIPGEQPKFWKTGPVTWALEGQYEAKEDVLNITHSEIQSAWVSGQLAGTVSRCRGDCYCLLGGTAKVDLDPLWQLISVESRDQIELTGLETRRIALRGPLRRVSAAPEPVPTSPAEPGSVATVSGVVQQVATHPVTNAAATSDPATGGSRLPPESLQLAAEVGWKQVRAYGVESQDAVVTVNFSSGKLLLTPTNVPVSGGRLVSEVKVYSTESPPVIEVPSGIVLERVGITESMCRTWLKYLSPMVADSARVDGQFSLSLQEGNWRDPNFLLRTKKQGSGVGVPIERFSGMLDIHEAHVGAGPLVQGPLGMIGQLQTVLRRGNANLANQTIDIQQQQIPFEVRDSRVYHSRFALQAGEVTFFSSGSVGFDETLDLLIEIQVPDTWFEKRPLLASARGQVLAIPIRGTFKKPEMDGRAFGQFAKSFGLDAATNAAGNLLERLIDKRK